MGCDDRSATATQPATGRCWGASTAGLGLTATGLGIAAAGVGLAASGVGPTACPGELRNPVGIPASCRPRSGPGDSGRCRWASGSTPPSRSTGAISRSSPRSARWCRSPTRCSPGCSSSSPGSPPSCDPPSRRSARRRSPRRRRSSSSTPISASSSSPSGLLLLSLLVVVPLGEAATTRAVSDRYLDRPSSLLAAYRAAWGRLGALIAMILILIVVYAGSLAVVILLAALLAAAGAGGLGAAARGAGVHRARPGADRDLRAHGRRRAGDRPRARVRVGRPAAELAA